MLVLIKNILQYKELVGVCVFSFIFLNLIFKDAKSIINALVKFTTLYTIIMLFLSKK
ncbi:hypothetical protein [Clostridium botulinum]|uniref:hypothetical protein n=1 Tax=Clostridium botulinum TaxID=1491 RepID=UPI00090AAC25|nr:hypothetical protein [Clostridium botulinum]APH21217.1 putative membrane protein [Clostridium botulinum]APQ67342.1 putative membrane protein [Clostridium botulinum]MBY6830672.1 hypothetical protein [Clostridium botulinum]MBY6923937.1 hypothetical protein [Clostridium botulinum]MBY6961205.1 hypothetical protein [Clostridium botulinum]